MVTPPIFIAFCLIKRLTSEVLVIIPRDLVSRVIISMALELSGFLIFFSSISSVISLLENRLTKLSVHDLPVFSP